MINFIKKEYKYLLALFFILIASFAVFWMKQANIFIDVGREFYIPSQMNKGFLLYKDLLNVYSPLSYQLNALLFKIFGESLSTPYNFGIINVFLLIFGIYFLSREFLSKSYSLLISTMIIGLYVITAGAFNYSFPYTFSMPYAVSSFLFSVLFLIKYVKGQNVKNLYLAAFLGGLSFDFKIEYVFYPFVLLYVAFMVKPLKKIELLTSLLCFIFMPLFSILVLMVQGVRIFDFVNAFNIMHKMTEAPSTKFFYKNYSGFMISYVAIFNNIKYFAVLVFMFLVASFREKFSACENKKNKYLMNIISFAVIYLSISLSYKGLLFPLSLINFCLFLFNIKKIYENKPLFVMALCALVATFKSMFIFAVNTYGIFAAPLLFISCISLFLYVFDSEEKQNILIKSVKYNLKLFLTVFILILFYVNYKYNDDKVILETPKGNIFVRTYIKSLHENLINYIMTNTKPTDRIVILPETPFLNFVTGRPTHNFYMCLIPVYIDVFGEKTIVAVFEKDMPEYFILNNRDCTEYGVKYFGFDFAKDIKLFIDNNYVFVKEFHSGKDVMIIYERKDIKWKKLH